MSVSRDLSSASKSLVDYVLGLGDDALILAQRLSMWVASAPELEEDVALANIALDQLGQARMLLTYAGTLSTPERSEDDLAYLREAQEFRNVQLVEIDNGDFGQTIARQLAFSTYQLLLYRRLVDSTDPTLAAVAAKAVKEVAYHLDHATQWTLRLGDGTEESRRRMQAGLDAVWPYVGELFETSGAILMLVAGGVAVDTRTLREEFDSRIAAVLAEATLSVPEPTWQARGGRRGIHTEGFESLVTEMQSLHRAHPGATW